MYTAFLCCHHVRKKKNHTSSDSYKVKVIRKLSLTCGACAADEGSGMPVDPEAFTTSVTMEARRVRQRSLLLHASGDSREHTRVRIEAAVTIDVRAVSDPLPPASLTPPSRSSPSISPPSSTPTSTDTVALSRMAFTRAVSTVRLGVPLCVLRATRRRQADRISDTHTAPGGTVRRVRYSRQGAIRERGCSK